MAETWVRLQDGGRGAQFALAEDVSAETLIPDWVSEGLLVDGFVLEALAREFGELSAEVVDDLSHPCLRCARNTYGPDGTLCRECEEAIRAERDLERAGAFSPRCDY